MVQDALDSLKLTMSERVSSPFVSAFFVSAIVVNWKLSILIFSGVEYEDKIEIISSLYPSLEPGIYGFVVWPLAAAFFWTFVWPLINWGVSAYWYLLKYKISNTRSIIERRRFLSEPEAALLYSQIDSQETKYLELLKERQEKIETLSDEAVKAESFSNEINESLLSAQKEINELKNDLYKERSEKSEIEHSRDRKKQLLNEVLVKSLSVSARLPGLKIVTKLINGSNNHQAKERWLKQQFSKIDPGASEEEIRNMIDFLIAVGIITVSYTHLTLPTMLPV